MKIEDDVKFDYADVLIRPKRSTLSTRSGVKIERVFRWKYCDTSYPMIPVWAANMDTIGTFEMANSFRDISDGYGHPMVAIHKHYTNDDWHRVSSTNTMLPFSNVAITFGMSDFSKKVGDYDWDDMYGKGLRYICLDVANGYTEKFTNTVKEVREWATNKYVIIAGNVVTREMTEALILAGADCIKIGIGGGSVCTTRKIAGVGYPQLSAVMECADAAHGMGAHIMADGGCVCPGDVAKAFGAGADMVMLGGMLAGHKESGGEATYDGHGELTHKTFYGMSSDTAMDKYNGGVASYRASEGKTVSVPYRGEVKDTLRDILGGIRSACTYVGTDDLKHLSKCCTFVRVNRQMNLIYGS